VEAWAVLPAPGARLGQSAPRRGRALQAAQPEEGCVEASGGRGPASPRDGGTEGPSARRLRRSRRPRAAEGRPSVPARAAASVSGPECPEREGRGRWGAPLPPAEARRGLRASAAPALREEGWGYAPCPQRGWRWRARPEPWGQTAPVRAPEASSPPGVQPARGAGRRAEGHRPVRAEKPWPVGAPAAAHPAERRCRPEGNSSAQAESASEARLGGAAQRPGAAGWRRRAKCRPGTARLRRCPQRRREFSPVAWGGVAAWPAARWRPGAVAGPASLGGRRARATAPRAAARRHGRWAARVESLRGGGRRCACRAAPSATAGPAGAEGPRPRRRKRGSRPQGASPPRTSDTSTRGWE
jgi:hypothetical protein